MCSINHERGNGFVGGMQLQTETNEDRDGDFSRIPLLSTSAFVSVCYE